MDLRWFKDTNMRFDPKFAPKKSITIKFHDGILNGQKFTFEDQDKITIGLSEKCDISLKHTDNNNSNLFQIHCILTYERGYWYIED